MGWMIYGAYGYTGRLIAARAVEQGLRPVLAGRNREAVESLARGLGLEWRAFSLESEATTRSGVEGMALVLHTAGPFSATSAPMVDACLATGAHYLDVTGEIAVFEAVMARDAEARDAGVVLLPGVGFDVVPTDCLAAKLSRALPEASHLELAFAGLNSPSRGTARTVVEGLGMGGAARIDGLLRIVPAGWRTRQVTFPSKQLHAVSIPWGDVSTAFHTTGIPNITTYMALPERVVPWLKLTGRMGPALQRDRVQRLLKRFVEWRVKGPDASTRRGGRSEVWGEARDARTGASVSGTLTCPEGYTLTADASLRVVEAALRGEIEPGAMTPAKALGADFVDTLEDVEVGPLCETSGV